MKCTKSKQNGQHQVVKQIIIQNLIHNCQPLDQKCEEGKGRTLGFENTMTAFLIFMVGVSVCLAVLVMEMVTKKMSSHEGNKTFGKMNDQNTNKGRPIISL